MSELTIKEIKEKNAYYQRIIDESKISPENLFFNKEQYKKSVTDWFSSLSVFPNTPLLTVEQMAKANDLKEAFEQAVKTILEEINTF